MSGISLLLVGAAWISAVAASPDGVNLAIDKGSTLDDIILSWTGGQPVFGVFRSLNPDEVTDPLNKLSETEERSWIDRPPTTGLHYYIITSPCIPDPPEICDHIDNDCDGFVDEDFRDDDGRYNDDHHCGDCGNDCSLLMFGGQEGVCSGYVYPTPACTIDCTSTTCYDCNGSPVDGCETCDPSPGQPICECSNGCEDWDGDIHNGCEVCP